MFYNRNFLILAFSICSSSLYAVLPEEITPQSSAQNQQRLAAATTAQTQRQQPYMYYETPHSARVYTRTPSPQPYANAQRDRRETYP